MKTLSNLIKESNFDSNPGNLNPAGVMNHLSPLYNIIVNVRNYFGARLGVIVEPGEDNVSLKLHSSKFVNPESVNAVLDEYMYPGRTTDSTLRQYIISQGLTNVKMVNLGMYYVVYFSPADIRAAENPDDMACPEADNECPCREQYAMNAEECELDTIKLDEGFDDEELEDKSAQEMRDLLNSEDKIHAAQKLSDYINKECEIKDPYYFKAVKDIDGNESIALRYKYQCRRPFGKTVDASRSLMNIYGTGDQAVWVGAFDGDCDKDMKALLDNVLKCLGAKATDDNCVWTISATVEPDGTATVNVDNGKKEGDQVNDEKIDLEKQKEELNKEEQNKTNEAPATEQE